MNKTLRHKQSIAGSDLARLAGGQAARKLRARRRGEPNVWTGFAMFGTVGWTIAVPVVAGALIGLWLDKRHPSPHSWTLALLAAGLTIGCWNAWHWIAAEQQAMHKEQEDDRE